jgi:restriction system protein
MARGRLLRQRYRDESTVAVLLDLPGWLVLVITVVAMLVVLFVGVAFDSLTGRPNFLLVGLTAIGALIFTGGLFWLASRDRLVRRRLLSQASTADELWALMPHDMADVATELFRLEGYVVTENKRPDLADGGVDFEIFKQGKTWLVQVKHWRQEVGVREARELWGLVASEGSAGGVLIGTWGFTKAAREFAEGKDLRLIDGAEFMRLRSELAGMPMGGSAEKDPLVSAGFATYVGALHRPACPKCQKPMVLVTMLRDTAINKQFWGCSDYPNCQASQRFAIPYLGPAEHAPNPKVDSV